MTHDISLSTWACTGLVAIGFVMMAVFTAVFVHDAVGHFRRGSLGLGLIGGFFALFFSAITVLLYVILISGLA